MCTAIVSSKWHCLPLRNNAIISQDLQAETRAEKLSLLTASQSGIGIDLPVTARGDSLFLEHETQLESRIPSSGISFYTQDPTLSAIYSSSGLVRSVVPIVTQVCFCVYNSCLQRGKGEIRDFEVKQGSERE